MPVRGRRCQLPRLLEQDVDVTSQWNVYWAGWIDPHTCRTIDPQKEPEPCC